MANMLFYITKTPHVAFNLLEKYQMYETSLNMHMKAT